MGFGQLLRAHRLRLEVSAEAVAHELQVHFTTVCRWERGEGMPAEDYTIVKIARFLNVPPGEMLEAAGRERGAYLLPVDGTERDKYAAIIASRWSMMTLDQARELTALFLDPPE